MPLYTDQMQREVEIPEFPQRIVSLVPSQTEFLHQIGLGERLVGLTKFCIHPKHWRKEKTVIGGTKNFRFEVIESLQPDLIIGNKEENYREGIEKLAEQYPVWMSDIYTLDDALAMMNELGGILGCSSETQSIVQEIQQGFTHWEESRQAPRKPRTAYLIWRKPYMAVGSHTFIDHMLAQAGFENVVEIPRYPELSIEALQELQLDVLLLSSEPYPFRDKHLEEFAEQLPNTKIKLVDGEAFSWYGSHLTTTPRYFEELWKSLQAAP